MKKFLLVILGVFAFMGIAQAAEVNSGAIGYWQTIDPQTHKPDSIIRIWENHHGKYQGKIVKIFLENGHKPTDLCTKCAVPNKNKPMMGLLIVWGFTQDGPGFYTNGKVLDPTIGKIYKCHMTLKNHGNVLDVHGYIGIPLFGRSATWYRVHPLG